MSGAPVSLSFILEVVLIKRFVSIFLAFVLAVGFAADLAPRGKAVAPLALAQAALASYVASTGYKIWVDNGTGSDVLALVSDLYDTWLDDISGDTPMTLEQFATGNYVFTDNSGNIILTKTAADTFQRFSDWISTNYDVIAGSSENKIVVPGSSGGYTFPQSQLGGTVYVSSLPDIHAFYDYVKSDSRGWTLNSSDAATINNLLSQYSALEIRVPPASSSIYSGTGSVIFIFANPSLNSNFRLEGMWVQSVTSNGPANQPVSINSLSNTGNGTMSIGQEYRSGYNKVFYSSINAVGAAGFPSLSVSLAQDVIDKASDVVSGKSLVLDVGAVAGDTADEIVDAVIAGYDTATGTLTVTDSIVDTAVIDTPVQPYPDVDSLGLPELGFALTTRFPFSIPWDIGAIYAALSHSEVPPVKTFDLIPPSVLARWGVNASASITLDFTQEKFQVLFAIIHWACIIGFCLGLATLTKRYIWTTGG